jgi:hypothetical protein
LYKVTLNELLSCVDIPSDILTNSFCKNVVIQKYYDSVMSSIMEACHLIIPRFTQKSHRCTVPGWNDYVDGKHSVASSAFLDWLAEGKPHHGFSFKIMTKMRAAFKLALRYCKQHEDMMRADSYTKSSSEKEFKSFWSSIIIMLNLFNMCDAINKQKLGKAIGPDGIAMEALVFGGINSFYIFVFCLTCF